MSFSLNQVIKNIQSGVVPRDSTLAKHNISEEKFNQYRTDAGLPSATLEYLRHRSVLPFGLPS